ncbi:hypothetical protein MNBD_GAMMA07-1185 [hydrothermal vent metagenome]|uniref:Uncharacterized protein n=1 Tax=hydrothermal vent metagenome TaxID=652676 RepID=A0A3B0WYG7_9ZZZZ
MKHLINVFVFLSGLVIMPLSFAEEVIEMDALSIIGNKELPNVLYILPWKQTDLPEMLELPLSNLIDGALQPIDRPTTLRQIYYKQDINKKTQVSQTGRK